jgi:hypothetical protein
VLIGYFFECVYSIFQLNDQFTLDFDRVPLGEKSRLELAITNLTDMESGIKAKIAKFKTRVRQFSIEIHGKKHHD